MPTTLYSTPTGTISILLLVPSGARTVILVAHAAPTSATARLEPIFRSALGRRAHGRLGDARVDPPTADTTPRRHIRSIILTAAAVFTTSILVAVRWVAITAGAPAPLARHGHDLVRPDRLARALNYPLARVLALLGQWALHAAPHEGIATTTTGV